jgi:hypothetical protein
MTTIHSETVGSISFSCLCVSEITKQLQRTAWKFLEQYFNRMISYVDNQVYL